MAQGDALEPASAAPVNLSKVGPGIFVLIPVFTFSDETKALEPCFTSDFSSVAFMQEEQGKTIAHASRNFTEMIC